MAGNIEQSLEEAINELKSRELVEDVEYIRPPLGKEDMENRPCGYVCKILSVFHKIKNNGGYTFSTMQVYIMIAAPFTYKFHYGGPKLESPVSPFKDLVESKFAAIKTAFGLEHIEIIIVDENKKSGKIEAIKATSGDDADVYTIKVWQKTASTLGYKIISKTTVVR